MKRRVVDRFFLWSLLTREYFIKQLPCAYQGMRMSVFMEKSGTGEWSPHLFKAEALQLLAGWIPFGRASPKFICAIARNSPTQGVIIHR